MERITIRSVTVPWLWLAEASAAKWAGKSNAEFWSKAAMVEYIDGARRLPTTIAIDREKLLPIFEKRLARYISADQIAQIISEDATLQNGNLNVGYLAVKIAETIEGKRQPNT